MLLTTSMRMTRCSRRSTAFTPSPGIDVPALRELAEQRGLPYAGSDGKTGCASCHFHAGADTRSKNQLSPGLNRMASLTSPNPDTTVQLGGVNYQFKLDDFPFHKLADVNNLGMEKP